MWFRAAFSASPLWLIVVALPPLRSCIIVRVQHSTLVVESFPAFYIALTYYGWLLYFLYSWIKVLQTFSWLVCFFFSLLLFFFSSICLGLKCLNVVMSKWRWSNFTVFILVSCCSCFLLCFVFVYFSVCDFVLFILLFSFGILVSANGTYVFLCLQSCACMIHLIDEEGLQFLSSVAV